MTVKTKERISSASDIGNITERLRIWHKSPRKFVEQGLNVKPEKWQIKAMEAIRDNDRVAIKSGHGVGKSALLAWTILWWLLTRHPAKIACTAPTSHQLDDVLWGEVSKWSRQLPEGLKSLISVTSEKVFLNADPRQSFAVARIFCRSTDCPEGEARSISGFSLGQHAFHCRRSVGCGAYYLRGRRGGYDRRGSENTAHWESYQNVRCIL